MQPDIDSLFAAIVLPKITYGLSVYAASPPDLKSAQKFLTCSCKRNYILKLKLYRPLLCPAEMKGKSVTDHQQDT